LLRAFRDSRPIDQSRARRAGSLFEVHVPIRLVHAAQVNHVFRARPAPEVICPDPGPAMQYGHVGFGKAITAKGFVVEELN
jgi:hypothetical protein